MQVLRAAGVRPSACIHIHIHTLKMDSDNEAAIGKVQSEEEIVTLAKKPKKKIGFTISGISCDTVCLTSIGTSCPPMFAVVTK